MNLDEKSVDHLIIGQGLAGSCLAWHSFFQKKSFVIVDPGVKETTSKMSAGLIDYLSGQRFSQPKYILEAIPESVEFYQKIEQLTGTSLIKERPCLRQFQSLNEYNLFHDRYSQSAPWLLNSTPPNSKNAPYGQVTTQCYVLNVSKFLDTTADFFSSNLHTDWFHFNAASITPSQVHWKHIQTQYVFYAIGAEIRNSSLFDDIDFQCSSGSILSVNINQQPAHQILNLGHWLVPLSSSSSFKFGATFRPNSDQYLTSRNDWNDLSKSLKQLVNRPVEFIGMQTGVRTTTATFQPILGAHGQFKQFFIINGLGSKGSLLAPYLGNKLLKHIYDQLPINIEFDIQTHISSKIFNV